MTKFWCFERMCNYPSNCFKIVKAHDTHIELTLRDRARAICLPIVIYITLHISSLSGWLQYLRKSTTLQRHELMWDAYLPVLRPTNAVPHPHRCGWEHWRSLTPGGWFNSLLSQSRKTLQQLCQARYRSTKLDWYIGERIVSIHNINSNGKYVLCKTMYHTRHRYWHQNCNTNQVLILGGYYVSDWNTDLNGSKHKNMFLSNPSPTSLEQM